MLFTTKDNKYILLLKGLNNYFLKKGYLMPLHCLRSLLMRLFCFLFFIAASLYSATFMDTVRQTWTRDYTQLKNWSSPFGSNIAILDFNSKVLSSEHPFDVVLRRSFALIKYLKDVSPVNSELNSAEAELQALKSQAVSGGNKDTLYYSARSILRHIALKNNPLLNFDRILFVEQGNCNSDGYYGGHFIDVEFGRGNNLGGGVMVLTRAFTDTPRVVNLLRNSVVQNGRLAGRSLNGGGFKSPELTFDGKTVYFAWNESNYSNTEYPWSKEACLHIFKVDTNGANLRQLTDTTYDDFSPCELPNGRVAFISTRRQGFGRCHDRYVPTFTLFSMKNDGSDIICLSYHETNEFDPSVDMNGKIIYTRWDYIDRSAEIAHHLWYCYPDGRDPRAPHGNYPINGERFGRPYAEYNFRSIPGSNQVICIAGPHHSQHYGPVILVNTEIEDDGANSQITVVTPEAGYPESMGGAYTNEWPDYGTPWPLSEDFYIVSYKDKGLYYLDRFGNRELLCATTSGLRANDPIPLRLRPRPSVLPTNTFQESDSVHSPNHKRATLTVKDVKVSDRSWGTVNPARIKWMRIVQFFSKTTYGADSPKIGYGSQQEPRMSLGLVPVEADGSVNCEAPVGKTLYFQLLDSNYMAVQSMFSGTYVHPGEQLTCTGCHESKWNTPSVNPNTLASRRRPSKLMPEVDGLEPVNYYRLVKPVFENTCTPCHMKSRKGPMDITYDLSYGAFRNYAFYGPRDEGFTPGEFGALSTRMGEVLLDSVHTSSVTLEERRRVFLWLDLLSNEYGDFFNLDKQAKGERVWPWLDMDSTNPQGVEWDYPLANYALDATPPSVPLGLQVQRSGNSQSVLNWQASQDAESGVCAYRIYRNGVSHAYTCSTSFKDNYLNVNDGYIPIRSRPLTLITGNRPEVFPYWLPR